MPSGKTHDAITFILAVPVFAVSSFFARDFWLSGILTSGFFIGGLVFGPDLDTASRQYSRWSILRFLWFPYRSFFKHRSRWSHGLIFGTILRVVYFMGIATLFAFILAYVYTTYAGGTLPGVWEFPRIWTQLREATDRVAGPYGVLVLFLGLWIGAASHTFTDLAGSYIKTGRVREFL